MKGKEAYGNMTLIWDSENPNPAIPLFVEKLAHINLVSQADPRLSIPVS
jgi:hypothetical protein